MSALEFRVQPSGCLLELDKLKLELGTDDFNL